MNRSFISENITRWSVLLACLLLPFFFVPAGWISVAAAKMLLLAVVVPVATLAWAASCLKDGWVKLPKSLLLAAAGLVPLAYIVSAFGTGATWTSFVGTADQDTVVAVCLWYALFLVSANTFAVSTRRVVAALSVFSLGGTVLLVIQLAHLLLPVFTFGGALTAPATSIIGGWLDLGIMSGFLLFSSLALLGTPVAQGLFWRVLLIANALMSLALLLSVNFADVWFGLAGLGLLYAAYLSTVARRAGPTLGNTFPRHVLLWLLFAAAALGMHWAGTPVHDALPAPLSVSQLEVRPSWQGTFAVGQRVFTQPSSIFFGSGPNTFLHEWSLYRPVSVNGTQFWNTDFYAGVGFIPTSLVTVGALGAVAWALVMLALLWSVLRIFFIRGSSAIVSRTHAIVAASALYLLVFHVLYIPSPALSAITFLLFGLLVAEELNAGFIRDLALPAGWGSAKGIVCTAALFVCALGILLGGIQSVRILASNALVNRAVSTYGAGAAIASTSRSVASALDIFPQNDRAHRAAVEIGLLELQGLISANDTSNTARLELQATLARTIEHGLDAVQLGGGDYQNWLELARLYGQLAGIGVKGADASARSAYAQAQKDNPASPLPLFGEAQLDIAAGDDASAREHLKAALALKADLASAHFLLSQIYGRLGDLASAQNEAVAAVELAPQDPLGWYNAGTTLYAGGDYRNAATAFERAVGIQNDYANALFLLGVSYYKLGRTSDALSAMKAVAAENPSDASLAGIVADLSAGKDPFATSTPVKK